MYMCLYAYAHTEKSVAAEQAAKTVTSRESEDESESENESENENESEFYLVHSESEFFCYLAIFMLKMVNIQRP
jgi:hypothetical protein